MGKALILFVKLRSALIFEMEEGGNPHFPHEIGGQGVRGPPHILHQIVKRVSYYLKNEIRPLFCPI
jgi:hypothetical protein